MLVDLAIHVDSRFSSVPVLTLPDPEKQFVVEVDASDTGVGAVLSQRAPDNKMHPCALFSCRLSPSERNYIFGDRELLVVMLALEEWCHLLEGASVLFLVWSDHQNMGVSLHRWSLFFSIFNFTLAYHPGSKNVKPDVLSKIHSAA